MKRNIILIHSCASERKPIPLMSCEAISKREIEMTIFYIQTVANEVNMHFSLSPMEMKDILVKFYDFEDLGKLSIKELRAMSLDEDEDEDEDDCWVYNVTSTTLEHKEFDIINIFFNWESNVDIYYLINTSETLYRDGLKEYIEEITKDFKLFK